MIKSWLLGLKGSEMSDENFFDSSKYDYIDETFADNLLEIVYTNLEDIRAGRFLKLQSVASNLSINIKYDFTYD